MHAWVVLDDGRRVVRAGTGDTAMANGELSAQMRIKIKSRTQPVGNKRLRVRSIETKGYRRPPIFGSRMLSSYCVQLLGASVEIATVVSCFYRAMHLLWPLSALLHSYALFSVLKWRLVFKRIYERRTHEIRCQPH